MKKGIRFDHIYCKKDDFHHETEKQVMTILKQFSSGPNKVLKSEDAWPNLSYPVKKKSILFENWSILISSKKKVLTTALPRIE